MSTPAQPSPAHTNHSTRKRDPSEPGTRCLRREKGGSARYAYTQSTLPRGLDWLHCPAQLGEPDAESEPREAVAWRCVCVLLGPPRAWVGWWVSNLGTQGKERKREGREGTTATDLGRWSAARQAARQASKQASKPPVSGISHPRTYLPTYLPTVPAHHSPSIRLFLANHSIPFHSFARLVVVLALDARLPPIQPATAIITPTYLSVTISAMQCTAAQHTDGTKAAGTWRKGKAEKTDRRTGLPAHEGEEPRGQASKPREETSREPTQIGVIGTASSASAAASSTPTWVPVDHHRREVLLFSFDFLRRSTH
ncbi:uncharacterized protein K452DRAFT_305498 [Aplosporella prunicola CBS 121167]|uniref:Uncharacterized protein n=1 Tax=Aplosporella prunicola CBS 121167 TaxID=1176127 RepID=A0A6A6BQG3_9PEZI|nr:uncharacterized protein K452DRAFT_305498 [Aplosporella prunicola CBS 121167]KAF2145484.1 hypothetical protein K452DRAFT_305498 [Aplosporella prunicola CBS 121167]